jgi:hypothetical protein
LHALHGGHDGVAQQAPSVQYPLAHSAGLLHAGPFTERHCPFPLHACAPAHMGLVSVPSTGMGVHVPTEPGRSHASQTVSQGVSQQTPSAQLSLRHV